MYRLFIGILLPDATRKILVATQQVLAEQNLAVRWIKPTNWHITLHFLGDVAPTNVPTIQHELDQRLTACRALPLTMHGLGAFPNLRKANVLWAGIAEGAAPIQAVYQHAVAAGESVGVSAEQRAYHPHITLGYVQKQATPQQRTQIVQQMQHIPAPYDQQRRYDQIALIRSVLTPSGANYTPLAIWNLAHE